MVRRRGGNDEVSGRPLIYKIARASVNVPFVEIPSCLKKKPKPTRIGSRKTAKVGETGPTKNIYEL